MELTFLGTAAMVPTKDRNPSSVFLTYKTDGLLFDCGEGTQRQMKIAGIPLTKITKILISHWHGDHVLGLPGLLQSLGASEYQGTLEIYGPSGSRKYLGNLMNAIPYEQRINIRLVEVEKDVFFESDAFQLEARPMSHGIPCVGFAFTEKDRRKINLSAVKKLGIPEGPLLGELQHNKSIDWKGKKISPKETTFLVKGKKIAFFTDTKVCKGCYELAKDADILICEGTYTSELQEKAEEYNHMTTKDAGLIASKSNVKKLVLTHFSARYKSVEALESDARSVFDNSFAAKDFLRISL